MLIPAFPAFSQADGSFWISPAAEMSMYDASNAAFGGGLALGCGSGVSVGLKASFFASAGGISTIELNFLLRYFFLGADAVSGPFLQLTAGPAFFFRQDDSIAIPSELGMVSAGLAFGWRFLFNRLFIEPAIRGGFPYLFGAGLSAGVRF